MTLPGYRPIRSNLFGVLVLVVLAGCTAPSIDLSSLEVDPAKYEHDLTNCQDGQFMAGVAQSIGRSLVGSVVGAAQGVVLGAAAGDRAEGAFIGAIAGSILGISFGMQNALKSHNAEIAACLRDKGYSVRTKTARPQNSGHLKL